MQAGCADEETEVQRVWAELQRVSAEAAQREAAARQQVAEVRGEAKQRQMQLAVIMETLEALQSGSDSEQSSTHAISLPQPSACFVCQGCAMRSLYLSTTAITGAARKTSG